jgi:hypothetical protein
VFRVGALHEELGKREHKSFSLPQIARRDLTRLYGLHRVVLRQMEADPGDVRRVATFLQGEDELFGTGSVEVLVAVVRTAAESSKASTIESLGAPESLALIDLIQRAGTPDEAETMYVAARDLGV